MPNYPIYTIASAPEGSKSALEQLQQAFGVLPNIAAAIANSPKLMLQNRSEWSPSLPRAPPG
jgi:hypothetical protein